MRVATDDWSLSGEAVDCREHGVPADAVAAAIACGPLDASATNGTAVTTPTDAADVTSGTADVRVTCPPPGAVFEHVGVVRSDASVDVRSALVAAARSRDVAVEERAALASARAELAAVEVPSVDVAAARERVATAREAEAAVHADVAAARGMVAAREELDADVDAGRERLRTAVATASERETERVAAEQALSRARERAREARDARSRRLELEDRVGRLERDVRGALVDAVWDAFADAVDAVPGDATAGDVGESAGAYEDDDVTAALAVARIANPAAPMVLAADRFVDAECARETLDASVILATP